VKHLGRPGEPGPSVVGRQPLEVGVGQPEGLDDLDDVALLAATVDVDPQQSLVAERADDLLRQLDVAIAGVRVEKADRELAQCSELSSSAAATAMKATRYWSASMARSWGFSASHDPLCLVAGSISIDVRTSKWCV
jgi:hypothetical protein